MQVYKASKFIRQNRKAILIKFSFHVSQETSDTEEKTETSA